MKFNNPISENIWEDRYKKNNETLKENIYRVAGYCGKTQEEKQQLFDVMWNGLFFPAGRTMSNSGIGSDLTLNNCFVAPQVKDDLTDIFEKVSLGAKTHQRGGGIGYDFSQIRPRGTPTSNDAIASGPVSFMDVFNAQTATILQGGRRGANMGVLNVYNMDIEDFITAKSYEAGKLNHFNVSVMVDDDFITAVRNNKDIYLHHPVYDKNGAILKDPKEWKLSKKVSAVKLWDLIIKRAYDNGEPGIFFYDNLNRDNNLWYIENIVCTNPCAEYLAGTLYGNNPITGEPIDPSQYGGACNLGSIFLQNFVENPFEKNARFNFLKLVDTVNVAVRFLDNIIDINNFPSEIYENYQKSFRTIGLGVTGLADMLAMLNLKYNTREAYDFVDDLMGALARIAYRASIDLAKEKGAFPLIDKEKFAESGYLTKHLKKANGEEWCLWADIIDDIKEYGIRNAKILSIAPVGTLSLTFGNNCSSGIEPIFSLSYKRKVKIGGQSDDNIQIVDMKDYAYGLWQEIPDSEKAIKNEKDLFVTALDMSVDEHVDMLSRIAYHVDMSVSKTINVPTSYTFEQVKGIYEKAYDCGIKGCTIFRPNEIRQGILISEEKKQEATKAPNNDVFSINDLPRGYVVDANVENLIIKTKKVTTGCGSLWVTMRFDPETGELFDTFWDKGSDGGCNSSMIGLSRMTSIAARGGIDTETLCDQLKSCPVCASYAVRRANKHDVSPGTCCPSAVAGCIMKTYEDIKREIQNEEEDVSYPEDCVDAIPNSFVPCPECGEPLDFEGGCNTCKACGYTKCG